MSDRREFLKQEGLLTAVPWPKLALPSWVPEAPENLARLGWRYANRSIEITLDGEPIVSSVCPG